MTDSNSKVRGAAATELQPSVESVDTKDDAAQRTAIAQSIEAADPDGSTDGQIEVARRWLLDDRIKHASVQEQKAFLKLKGISNGFIDELLSEVKPEAQQSSPGVTPPPPHEQSYKQPSTPPVITYPEFLIRQKNPPIVTPTRLLTTAYVAGAFASTVYGVSKFLIQPMFQQLTEARQDMSSHTLAKLDSLNERLLKVASIDPSHAKKSGTGDDDDSSLLDSEPTELFSHDASTQTDTPPQLERQKMPNTPLDTQLASVRSIQSSMQQLADVDNDLRDDGQESLRAAQGCSTALDSLIYQNRYDSSGTWQSSGQPKKKDAAAELTAEIRSVKGALLNMRFSGNRYAASVGEV